MSSHQLRNNKKTSGIPKGYRLVSTYDLPDCKTILKFEIWSFSNFGGGGYSETLGFGLSGNLHLGEGIFWNSGIWTLAIFIWGEGDILKLSDLDSLAIFIWGVFWNSRIWTLWQFSFCGGEGRGGEGGILQNRGILWDLDQNFNHSNRLMYHR